MGPAVSATPQAALARIRAVGERAILVELHDQAEVLSLATQLHAHPHQGQGEVIPGARTVLITAVSTTAARALAGHVRGLDLSTPAAVDDTLVVLDTVYDGADIDDVAELTGINRHNVVAAHSGQTWTAAFGGFAPGFVYLTGENPQLDVPRRSSPRTTVPAGSVALAGSFCAVYPRRSPGGWQLIGRTAAPLWDLRREDPALLHPGNRVRFRPVRDLVEVRDPAEAHTGQPGSPVQPAAVVVGAGLQTTIQDLGRPGYGSLGVPASGALDRAALRRANRLVGNPAAAAALETVLGGLVLEAGTDQVLALTGAPATGAITTADGVHRTAPAQAPFVLHAAERLTLSTPAWGMRSYLAFRGGLDVSAVLGSRATDTLSGLGPDALAAGSRLFVAEAPPGSVVGAPEVAPGPPAEVTTLRIVPGPRTDWFGTAGLNQFCVRTWSVGSRSNRIGLRLEGESLRRNRTNELASEGTVAGAVQVPADGLPVLFLADHPVTGGYPVIGVVVSADLDRAAQLRPGARIRFAVEAGAGPVPDAPDAPDDHFVPGPAPDLHPEQPTKKAIRTCAKS